MPVPVTSRDAWAEFVDGCGCGIPVRTTEGLKHMIYLLPISYRGGENADPELWGAAWQAMYDTGWAWDPVVEDEAVVAEFERLTGHKASA